MTTRPRTSTRMFDGKMQPGDDFGDLVSRLSQIFAGRRHVDIHLGLELVVIHFGGSGNRLDVGDLIEIGGQLQIRGAQRHRFQIFNRLHLVFRILDGDEIVVAASGIDPVARGDHHVGGKGGDDVVDHFLRAQAEFAGARAVHVHLQAGVIHVLRHVDVRHAADCFELPGETESDVIDGRQIQPAYLHVDRRGHALVQHGIHQAAGLEVGAQLRHFLGDPRADLAPCSRSCCRDALR